MLSPTQLQVFAMAADTENFSEAARRLGVTQPTVSMHIHALEERLGLELFMRSGRTVLLTAAGRALVPMARDLLQRCVRIEETMASIRGEVVGLLEIACTTASGKYVLPRILAGLRSDHPGVEVVCLVTGRHQAIDMLRAGKVQVAISSLWEPSKDLEYEAFATDRIVLIAPPSHRWALSDGPIDVEELQRGEFIWREKGSGTRVAVQEALANHRLAVEDLRRVMELGNSEAIRSAVTEGLGVAFVSALVAAEARPGDVAVVEVKDLTPEQTIFMVRDTSRPETRAQAAYWAYAFSDECAALRARITNPERHPV